MAKPRDQHAAFVDRRLDSEIEYAFRTLPGRFREVMALIDIEGFSYAEAAEALGLLPGTVMSRLTQLGSGSLSICAGWGSTRLAGLRCSRCRLAHSTQTGSGPPP